MLWLIDYEVRIPPGGQTSALVECKISWQQVAEKRVMTTRGVDPDQVNAAIRATERMLNVILRK
jgi:(R)-citramalate synthase